MRRLPVKRRCLIKHAMIEGLPRPFTRSEAKSISSAAQTAARKLLHRRKKPDA